MKKPIFFALILACFSARGQQTYQYTSIKSEASYADGFGLPREQCFDSSGTISISADTLKIDDQVFIHPRKRDTAICSNIVTYYTTWTRIRKGKRKASQIQTAMLHVDDRLDLFFLINPSLIITYQIKDTDHD